MWYDEFPAGATRKGADNRSCGLPHTNALVIQAHVQSGLPTAECVTCDDTFTGVAACTLKTG